MGTHAHAPFVHTHYSFMLRLILRLSIYIASDRLPGVWIVHARMHTSTEDESSEPGKKWYVCSNFELPSEPPRMDECDGDNGAQ